MKHFAGRLLKCTDTFFIGKYESLLQALTRNQEWLIQGGTRRVSTAEEQTTSPAIERHRRFHRA